jgi:hypothetical protein
VSRTLRRRLARLALPLLAAVLALPEGAEAGRSGARLWLAPLHATLEQTDAG